MAKLAIDVSIKFKISKILYLKGVVKVRKGNKAEKDKQKNNIGTKRTDSSDWQQKNDNKEREKH